MKPRALVLMGEGINCERETAAALTMAGAAPETLHVSDLVRAPERLRAAQLFVLPGGFSYGDDTGAGNALARRLDHGLGDALRTFVDGGGLVLGVCNGFQVLVRLGLLEGVRAAEAQLALLPNDPLGFQCRWVGCTVGDGASPWLEGSRGRRVWLPIAHGEGRLRAPAALRDRLRAGGQLALRYTENPNGSDDAIAGLTDPTGRVFGLMPHPERAFVFEQREDWVAAADRLRRRGLAHPVFADGAPFFFAAVRALGGTPPDPSQRSAS